MVYVFDAIDKPVVIFKSEQEFLICSLINATSFAIGLLLFMTKWISQINFVPNIPPKLHVPVKEVS